MLLICGAVVVALAFGFAALGESTDATEPPSANRSDALLADDGVAQVASPHETEDVEPGDKPAEAEAVTSPELSGSSADVLQRLNGLTVVSGYSDLDYDRGLFGQAWFDQDRNGCDTRNDMLGRDLRDITFKEGTNNCKVLSGVLDDWYSGTTVEFVSGGDTSRLVQIDHVVPLAWAWRHGADVWTDEKRREFANDPLNLVATTDVMNQSKSDSGPNSWLPADDKAQCRYAQRFTDALDAYDLGIDLRARSMFRGVLVECSTSGVFGEFAKGADATGVAR